MKLKTPIGFHTGMPSQTDGLGEYQRSLARAGHAICAKGADNAGPVYEAQELAKLYPNPHHALVYRKVTFDFLGGGTDVPNYGADPAHHAKLYWDEMEERWPPELDKNMVYAEFPNEVDKNKSPWLGELLYYVGLEAIQRGRKYCGPAWSGGEPEPENWFHFRKYLELCQEYPDRLAVSVHEYTFSSDAVLMDSVDWLIGRVLHLNNACATMGIEPPRVFITEGGWGANDAPDPSDGVPQLLDMLKFYIEEAPNVSGFSLWCLDRNWQWSSLSKQITKYLTPLSAAIMATEWPDKGEIVVPEPPDPPGETGMIVNPHFNDGWEDHPIHPDRIQIANGWNVTVKEPGELQSAVNQKTGKRETITGSIEMKHLARVPDDEQHGGENELVQFPPWPLKMQAVTMCSETDFDQRVEGLEPGAVYTFQFDLKTHYQPNAGSIGDDSPDDIEIWVYANESNAAYIVADLPDRPKWDDWTELPVTGVADANGHMYLGLKFMTKWANSRDIFLGSASLTKVSTPTGKPKIVIVKIPQEMELDSATNVFVEAFNWYKRTVTASHDDMLTMLAAGNEDSYAVIVDPWQKSQQEAIVHLVQHGYSYELWYEDSAPSEITPLDGLTLGPLFDYKYIKTSSFNDPRSYGNGLHEGVDFDIIGTDADFKVDVLCTFDGVVDRVATTDGYGIQVRVKSYHNNGAFFHRYAHLDKSYVIVGQNVYEGGALGELGNTGNSFGEHVHFNLECPGCGLSGYVVPDVVDPWPYCFKGGYDLPTYSNTLQQHDVLAYILPETVNGPMYEVRHPSGATETFQMQHGANETGWFTFYQVKNHQWEMFHLGRVDGIEYIWRSFDTSPGPAPSYDPRPGTQRLYTQFEYGRKAARWCKRFMTLGEVYNGPGHLVEFYYKEPGCPDSPANSGGATNRITLLKHYEALEFNGIVINDIIEMTNGNETWFFARGFGLVAWRSKDPVAESAIIEMISGRPPLIRESVC